MNRAKSSWLSSRRLLGITGALVTVHALLPPRLTPWTEIGRVPLELLVQPIQRPITSLVHRFSGPAVPSLSDDPRIAQLQVQLEHRSLQYQQQLDEIARLRRTISEMQLGLQVSPNLPVVQIPAPVVGGGADHASSVLKVRAGRRGGITPYNTVAVVQGVYLVGRVTANAAPFFEVVPITDRRAPRFEGVIMLDDTTRGPRCSLVPTGKGTLRGDVALPEGAVEPPALAEGMTVRLSDSTWPDHAQGLIVGTITKIESKPTQSLRGVITVTPKVRIDRVSELVLRVLGEVTDEDTPAAAPERPIARDGAGMRGAP